MIEKDIKKYLFGSNAIRNVVGNRMYAANAPSGIKGALLILRNVTSERFYTLTGEIPTKQSVLQIDCYDETTSKAYALSELVRNRLSGYRGTAGDVEVYSATIQGERADVEKPQDKSDKWVHRYSMDYKIIHSQPVPTLT